MINCAEPGCDNKVRYFGQYCLIHMDYICKGMPPVKDNLIAPGKQSFRLREKN